MTTKTNTKSWYAIYTKSRAEKKVHVELQQMGVESFLPLQKTLRQWKDRKKWVEVPLLSGYCFVRVDRREYDRVLQLNNVVCYITFEGRAAVIPDKQIGDLKTILQQSEVELEVSNENFEAGQQVEIIAGPMIGVRGELIDIRGKNKFLLRIAEMNTSIVIEVAANDLTALPQ